MQSWSFCLTCSCGEDCWTVGGEGPTGKGGDIQTPPEGLLLGGGSALAVAAASSPASACSTFCITQKDDTQSVGAYPLWEPQWEPLPEPQTAQGTREKGSNCTGTVKKSTENERVLLWSPSETCQQKKLALPFSSGVLRR